MDRDTKSAIRRTIGAAALWGLFAHLLLLALAYAINYAADLEWQLFYLLAGWSVGLLGHTVTALVASRLVGLGNYERLIRKTELEDATILFR
jgi:hypothetical protein